MGEGKEWGRGKGGGGEGLGEGREWGKERGWRRGGGPTVHGATTQQQTTLNARRLKSLRIKEEVKEMKRMETSGEGSLSKERHLSEDWRRKH